MEVYMKLDGISSNLSLRRSNDMKRVEIVSNGNEGDDCRTSAEMLGLLHRNQTFTNL